MIDVEPKMSPDVRKAYLEESVLHLQEPVFHGDSSSYYTDALRNQAVFVVDFLTQILDEGIERRNLTIADYSSQRGDRENLLVTHYNGQLAAAIHDLGIAAGLRLDFPKGPEGNKFYYPELFRDASANLQLPQALSARIEAVSHPSTGGRPPDFRLKLTFDVDLKSYGRDYPQPTHSYQMFHHALSIVPPK